MMSPSYKTIDALILVPDGFGYLERALQEANRHPGYRYQLKVSRNSKLMILEKEREINLESTHIRRHHPAARS